MHQQQQHRYKPGESVPPTAKGDIECTACVAKPSRDKHSVMSNSETPFSHMRMLAADVNMDKFGLCDACVCTKQ